MFLNKFDLLEKKLAAGLKINKYLPSFGERENAASVLARCAFSLPFCQSSCALDLSRDSAGTVRG